MKNHLKKKIDSQLHSLHGILQKQTQSACGWSKVVRARGRRLLRTYRSRKLLRNRNLKEKCVLSRTHCEEREWPAVTARPLPIRRRRQCSSGLKDGAPVATRTMAFGRSYTNGG